MRIFKFLGVAALLSVSASAWGAQSCDRACLEGQVTDYMAALVAQEPGRLPWGDAVRFTENNIPMMVGDSIWGTIDAASDTPFIAADVEAGTVAWMGWITEHGAPAYHGVMLRIEDGKIADVDTVVARQRNSDLFGEPLKYKIDGAFSKALGSGDQTSRQRLTDIAGGYYSTLQQNNGTLFTQFARNCSRVENGVSVTSGKEGPAALAKGCEAQMKLGVYAPVTYVSDRRYPLVDAERGVVIAFAHRDYAARSRDFVTTDGKVHHIEGLYYPKTFGVIEAFKIDGKGEIAQIETISTMLPYRMPSPWRR